MVQNTFEAKEVVLGKLFDNDYLFRMPLYQRPYSWTTEETGELLYDLLNAMDEEGNEPYFLGSIVLIARPNSSEHEVIDGQQRLTTLTMLFCVLRELNNDTEKRASLDSRVREARDVFAGRRDRFRLSIRKTDEDFFRDNVQTQDKINGFIAGHPVHAPDSRKLIFSSVKFLYEELKELSEQERDALSGFLIGNCYLVVVTAYDRDSAHRIFSILNDRGMDLTPTDILKSDVIGDIRGNDAEKYTQLWEDIEDDMGRERFRELFAHIFVIETGNRFHKELAKAFQSDVLSKYNGAEFVDKVLGRYAQAFNVVTKSSYESPVHAEDVNRMLVHLNGIDNDDWIPLAMVFYDKYERDPDTLLELLKNLDRLAYVMFITGTRRDPRILRYRDSLNTVKCDDSGSNEVIEHLELAPDEKVEVISALDGPIYRPRPVARFVRPLLLRLDSMLADANASYDHKTITVEHILPQSPEPESEWVDNFPDEEDRIDWTHRLANLVLLSRSKNARAQNYDFDRKKNEYFQKNGVAGFALTAQVVNEPKWTPSVLKRRQNMLIDTFKTEWNLN